MLKIFRSALEGPLKWVFVALIIAAFGVFGVPSLDNFGNTSALTIEGRRISALDVQREVASQMRQIQAENPGISQEQAMAAGLGQQVVNVLTVRALIEAEADRLGVTAPDTVIRRYIEQLPDLQNPETGNFDPQRLGLVLQQLRLSTRGFGDLIGGELVRQQIVDALSSGGTVSNELTRYLLLRQFEERDIRFTTLTLDDAAAEPSEEDIAAYYEENIANYQSPEYRVYSVVTITEADVADEITVSEEDIRRLFDVRVGAVEASETRSVNQFRVSGDAVTEVEELLAQGQTFAAVAEAVGAQVSTLADQQQTDFIAEAFGEAVFAAESGAIIGPVDTPFGALFGEVVAINRAEGPVFEDEREALEAELRSEIAEDLLVDLVDRFEIARDEGASIAEAADQVGLIARTTQPADAELFTRFGSIANI
ncbi:MAG: peptidylprolyl isomerase, partial [Pseudomonadota bacterium]